LGKLFTARPLPWSFWLAAGLLPIVPDFDAFSTCNYGTICGHRGFTHSLLFAVVLSAGAAALTSRYFRMRFLTLAAIFSAITISHAVLDAFTNGGYGVPLFWPLSTERFGPYGPIQVADIGFELPNPWRSRSIRTELLYVWLPMAAMLTLVAIARRYLRSHRMR
jgi:inner membrane protein